MWDMAQLNQLFSGSNESVSPSFRIGPHKLIDPNEHTMTHAFYLLAHEILISFKVENI